MAKYTINESQLRSAIEEQVKAYLMEAYENGTIINEDETDEANRVGAFFAPVVNKVAEKGRQLYNNVAGGVGKLKTGIEKTIEAGKENARKQGEANASQRIADKGAKMVEKTIQQLENIKTHYNAQKEDKYAISRAITALKRIMNNAFESAKEMQAKVETFRMPQNNQPQQPQQQTQQQPQQQNVQ